MIIYWIGGMSGIKTKVKIIFLLLQLLITSIIIKTINFLFYYYMPMMLGFLDI